MTQRVVLGALPGGGHGLRVSRPGYNVLDTGLTGKQVAFDSRWAFISRLHQTATVSVSGTSGFPEYQAFGFGVDFGVIPPLFAFGISGATLSPLTEGMIGSLTFWENYAPNEYSSVRVFSDRVEFLRSVSAKSIRYFVLRPL